MAFLKETFGLVAFLLRYPDYALNSPCNNLRFKASDNPAKKLILDNSFHG